MPDYIEELNEGQRNAVLYNDGPSLVIAGAGSGKTRVLTYKIAYLLENGYQPWNILALTFTNKAAREMKERIARQVGPERARHLWMGTFHSMFLRILHVEAGYIGFTSQFTIYDTADSKSLIRSIIKEMGLDEKVYKPGMVQARISNAKNHLVSPAGYANNKEAYEGDRAAKVPALRDIYQRYWERCRQADAMDFDDLLFYTFLLFRDHPEVLARYQDQFRYILVDEYQDTNFTQHSIVLQLAKNHQHVCVVGDDAQSIYSYRMTDFDMRTIPPGIIDHKEWTPENGRNNALRINGLGAPRAFYTPLLRKLNLPNTSYGEDYALGLRISREYPIGRIYDVLYLCRRWEDNSDASLDVVKMNNHNIYKDKIRTWELEARLNMERQ